MTVAVVLGMHKSGTSLISEILHHSGIEMVEAEEPLLAYQDKFHHERRITNELNKDLLGAREQYSLDTVEPIDPASVDERTRQSALEFVAGMENRQIDWGFKDPRTCLTYEFWREILPRHKLVCVFREAGEVLQHYGKVRKGDDFRALRAWYRYNQAMLAAFERTPESDRIMVHYRSLMEGDQGIADLAAFLDRPLTDRRRDNLLRCRSGSGLKFRAKALLHRFQTSQDVGALNRRLHKLAASG